MRRIWRAVAGIPPGRIASYGQVAELAGIPRGARQVGRALRLAPDELELPWFRVVRAGGTLAFERGSAAFEKQSALLAEDGVPIVNGRVDMRQYGWRPDLDELLWKPGPDWDED